MKEDIIRMAREAGGGTTWWPLHTDTLERKPDYKEFMEWASSKGYDTAYTVNSDTGEFIALNPQTADLWKAWQAAHGIKGEA